jgi:hypothetical protein
MLPLRDLWFQGHEGAFSKTKASGEERGVEAWSPGLPEIKERSGIWNLVPVG